MRPSLVTLIDTIVYGFGKIKNCDEKKYYSVSVKLPKKFTKMFVFYILFTYSTCFIALFSFRPPNHFTLFICI